MSSNWSHHKPDICCRNDRVKFYVEALSTRADTDIWTEIRPVDVLHCVNGDEPKFRQNECGTPYVAVQSKIGVGVSVVTCEQSLSHFFLFTRE